VAMGFSSVLKKMFLPAWLMLGVAAVVVFLGDIYAAMTGTPKHIVNYHLKLNPFAVKMLVIDRCVRLGSVYFVRTRLTVGVCV
jgi:hypothetical protein